MAELITRHPEYRSDAERRTVETLVDELPKGWFVAHGVGWTSRDADRRQRSSEADVVVVGPPGFCVIEVKGGRIERRGTQWFSIDHRGVAHKLARDPADQALASAKNLRDHLSGLGIARCESAHAVALPDCVADGRSLGMNLDGGVLIDGEAFPCIGTRVRDLLDVQGGARLGPADLDRISKMLEPSWTLGGDLGLEIGRVDKEAAELTELQHRALKSLQRQRRVVVSGGPGTGKSVLALRFAVDLAATGHEVLYVCYNRPLAETQKESVGSSAPTLTVSTFHELCSRWAERSGTNVGTPPPRGDREALSRYFDGLMRAVVGSVQIPQDVRFDAIVVDEGQDFSQEWIDFLQYALADPDGNGFYLFLDPTQKIYVDADAPRLEDALEWRLDQQCRTGARLARSVARFLGDPEPECLLEEGEPLDVIEVDSLGDTPDALRRLLHDLLAERGVAREEIVVQTGVAGSKSRVWGGKLGNIRLAGRDPDSHEAPPPLRHDEVRIETIHRFKGLETPATVLVEIDPSTKADLRTLVRIGLTRAQVYAAIIVTPDVRALFGNP